MGRVRRSWSLQAWGVILITSVALGVLTAALTALVRFGWSLFLLIRYGCEC